MNTEHQLKLKSAWFVFTKSFKYKKNGTGENNTANSEVFIGL